MRSFEVTAATDFETAATRWVGNHVLTCRPCDESHPMKGAFVPSVAIKVGQRLFCPHCGEQSIVPKKPRWRQ